MKIRFSKFDADRSKEYRMKLVSLESMEAIEDVLNDIGNNFTIELV